MIWLRFTGATILRRLGLLTLRLQAAKPQQAVDHVISL